jgi:hypothetical protein
MMVDFPFQGAVARPLNPNIGKSVMSEELPLIIQAFGAAID